MVAPTGPPKFSVVLGDHGLTYSPRRIAAGRYVVSFTDHRAHRPAGEKIELQFGPSGPLFPLLTVPLGRHVKGILEANEIPWLVTNGVRKYFDGTDSPTIVTSPQFPTPAT